MNNNKIILIGNKEFLSHFLQTDFYKSAKELYDYSQQLFSENDPNWTTVLQASAEKNHPEAAFLLGSLIINNPNCPFPASDGFRFLKIAASQGHPYAMTNLATCYQLGKGCKIDYEEAIELLTQASELGDEMASYNLAQTLYLGVGVPCQKEKALRILNKLAADGVALAKDFLGKISYDNQK